MNIVPYLSVSDASAALDFYARAFETEPYLLLRMPDGRVMQEIEKAAAKMFAQSE